MAIRSRDGMEIAVVILLGTVLMTPLSSQPGIAHTWLFSRYVGFSGTGPVISVALPSR
jgi:hypothetical protein